MVAARKYSLSFQQAYGETAALCCWKQYGHMTLFNSFNVLERRPDHDSILDLQRGLVKQKQLGMNGQLHICSVTALVRSKDTQGEALRAKPDLLSGANGGMRPAAATRRLSFWARVTERCLDSLRTALN
jgi:hypothetical protein